MHKSSTVAPVLPTVGRVRKYAIAVLATLLVPAAAAGTTALHPHHHTGVITADPGWDSTTVPSGSGSGTLR